MSKKQMNLTKNREYFYLLGVLLGDGNIQKDRIRIAVIDKDFILKCKSCIKRCLHRNCLIRKRKNNGFKEYHSFPLYHLQFNSIIFPKIVKKDVKKLILLKEKEKMCAFLEGIYDSEGCVDKDRMRIRLRMRDFSENTIKIISLYLAHLKIKYLIRKEKLITRGVKAGWLLVDIDREGSAKFQELITFSIKKKRERLRKHYNFYTKDWINEARKREETLILKEKEWCKKYDLTRNQYHRHRRILVKASH